MYNPIATYRIQFHKDFSFTHLEAALHYLQKLGISSLYASPIFHSVPGSTHGYDGLDPNKINPEIGNLSQLRRIAGKLRESGIGWLQDIVPNHMAYHSGNRWLMDVLEKGDRSPYRKFFDIIQAQGKIMVPFLASSLEEAIENKELQLAWQDDRIVMRHFENHYPVQRASYASILRLCSENETALLLASRIDALQHDSAPEDWDNILKDLAEAKANGTEIDLEKLNGDKEILKGILDQQYYRFCQWKETDSQINYRRFFTVNGLICMHANDTEVFDAYHGLVKNLLSEKILQGLRVDHADGLYDPKSYLERLREMAGEDVYIVIEKILAKDEWLPEDWPIQGNTGYDFLSVVNNLFTNKSSEKLLSRFYNGFSLSKETIPQQARRKKTLILHRHMQGELTNLYELFRELQLSSQEELERYGDDAIRSLIGALLIYMPVYRFYGTSMPLSEEEEGSMQALFRQVRQAEPEKAETAYWLEDILLERPKKGDNDLRLRTAHFYKRLMQFSGPLMAKGVEDTLMYTNNRLLSRNEVGDTPELFGLDADQFHRLMMERSEKCPLSMNATATHDTKRGEDARARLNVIPDLAEEWIRLVKEWMQLNADLKQDGAPEVNDEYMIYQAILGSYPFDPAEEQKFPERLKAFLIKALREGKTNSNWSDPDETYEEKTWQFARALLDKQKPFWKSFSGFLEKAAEYGMVNSLVQLTLKFTAPGVPDIYQGCELWDLSFVDPDNRRPVDYEKRMRLLDEVRNASAIDLWNSRQDGSVKLWLTRELLQLRKEYESLFTAGSYVPVEIKGKYKEHLIAYGRKLGGEMLVTVLPLHIASVSNGVFMEHDWEDTRIVLPPGVEEDARQVLGGSLQTSEKELPVGALLGHLPVAIIRVKLKPKERKAGILLHLTSLPSAYGIGDMGPGSFRFVDFLSRSGQSLWQVLPLNPTSEGQAHSPYSATSSMAGNPLLISPELLAENGWLEEEDLKSIPQQDNKKVGFGPVENWKTALFSKAWLSFREGDQSAFRAYCEQEHAWLHDFSLFTLLKEMNEGKAWSAWEDRWKFRDPASLEQLADQEKERLDHIKWLQFIFHEQWSGLRRYTNSKGISIVGDLPFYVSYDSADVWVNRQLFDLTENGGMNSVAGVPPDAFSADGQLWGMPVFNWQKMRESGYQWWISRIRKNKELFDALRLDHFRAFSAYWEVNATDETAKNGSWKEGPGSEFFGVLRSALGDLPFIAEDLGDIDEPVRKLRDEFQLPGMKVLQFAFGDHFGKSEFLPHHHAQNFVVYTGTHDNNTVKGWWLDEADKHTRKMLREYLGTEVNAENIAEHFCRLAYGSVANQVIIPVQDLLGLDGSSRMNRPSSVEDNWSWRLMPGQLTPEVEIKLRRWTRIYDR